MVYKSIKLNLEAGQATPTPPIGPILGQQGININKFCTDYNKLTKNYTGLMIPVRVDIFENKTFNIKLQIPSSSYLLNLFSLNKVITLKNFIKIINIKKRQMFPTPGYKIICTLKNQLKLMNIKLDLN